MERTDGDGGGQGGVVVREESFQRLYLLGEIVDSGFRHLES